MLDQSILYVTAENGLNLYRPEGAELAYVAKDKVQAVTCDYGANIWIITTIADEDAEGGAVVKFSSDQWNYALPGGKKIGASQIIGGQKGTCYLITPDGAIHKVDTKGNETELFGAGTAIDIAYGPIGSDYSKCVVWVLTSEVYVAPGDDWQKTGNMVKYFKDGDKALKSLSDTETYVASKLSGFADFRALAVLPDGNIWLLTADGKTHFEMDGIVGIMDWDSGPPNKLLLAVSEEAHPKGGNVIKYYEGDRWEKISRGTTFGALGVSNYYG